MPMGTSACYADVIDVKDVKKLAPIAYKNFLKVLKQQKVTLEDFAKQYQYNDIENDKCMAAWNKLAEYFNENTKVMIADNGGIFGNGWRMSEGLQLSIGWHDLDGEGDRYDEVNGVFFSVDGMYCLTPTGKAFNKIVERKFYTQFG
jgi:hypothetical protein